MTNNQTERYEIAERRFAVVARIISLTSICVALLVFATQVQCVTYDDDTLLEFYWEPASGNVDHYNVFLHNMTDEVIYPQLGENEEHPLEWTTPTVPTETDPYPVPIDAEPGKTYQLQVQAVAADGTTGPPSEWSEPVVVVQRLYLHKGWNLISIYLDIVDTNLSSVLASIEGEGECRSVWTYDYDAELDSKIWRRYIVGGSDYLNTLQTMEHGKGYWINMTGDATLMIVGNPINESYIPLYSGWNLVGYSSSIPQPAEDGLPFTDANHTSIWTYDSMTENWLRYVIDAPDFLNTLSQLVPGSGYWLYVE